MSYAYLSHSLGTRTKEARKILEIILDISFPSAIFHNSFPALGNSYNKADIGKYTKIYMIKSTFQEFTKNLYHNEFVFQSNFHEVLKSS